MSRRPPLILLNLATQGGEQDADPEKLVLGAAYPCAVAKAGGRPILIPLHYGDIDRCLEIADGVILVGGPDYPSAVYGEEDLGFTKPVHPRRAEADTALARRALEIGLPVLGICGGAQLINIVLGGTLFQDIAAQIPGALVHQAQDGKAAEHVVAVSRGSALHSWAGEETFRVNSYHHQSIKRLGRGITPTAHAPDGVIEAAEALNSSGSLAAMAIQWHPERLLDVPASFGIFAAFVDWARRGRP